MSNVNNSTHLVIIADLSPCKRLMDDLFEHWLNSIIAFANTHLILNESNGLTFIGCHIDINSFIYSTCKINESNILCREEAVNVPREGQPDRIAHLTQEVGNGIKKLIQQAAENAKSRKPSSTPIEPCISSSLSLALCNINKRKEFFSSSRVAIITPNVDYSYFLTSQYMNFMNAFFTAQKMGVVIDVVTGISDTTGGRDGGGSSILRQGCDITEGTYMAIPNMSSLLQYLLWVLTPSTETRDKMVLPPKNAATSRPACFCHRHLLEIGFVCSVCLSVFCQVSSICSTCKTVFNLSSAEPTKNKTIS